MIDRSVKDSAVVETPPGYVRIGAADLATILDHTAAAYAAVALASALVRDGPRQVMASMEELAISMDAHRVTASRIYGPLAADLLAIPQGRSVPWPEPWLYPSETLSKFDPGAIWPNLAYETKGLLRIVRRAIQRTPPRYRPGLWKLTPAAAIQVAERILRRMCEEARGGWILALAVYEIVYRVLASLVSWVNRNHAPPGPLAHLLDVIAAHGPPAGDLFGLPMGRCAV